MHRFIDGEERMQQALLPPSLEDYVSEENPVRVIEVFIDELDLAALGFARMTPAATGRPAYHPSTHRLDRRAIVLAEVGNRPQRSPFWGKGQNHRIRDLRVNFNSIISLNPGVIAGSRRLIP